MLFWKAVCSVQGKSFFAGGSSYPEDPSEEISIHACADPREEAEFAARTILSLRQEKGLAFREIALISGDMETYAREIRRIFPESGIACFIDETKRVLLNPFLEFIKAALEMLIRDFSYETVFRFLRCGLLDIHQESLDDVENYCPGSQGSGDMLSGKKNGHRRPEAFPEKICRG